MIAASTVNKAGILKLLCMVNCMLSYTPRRNKICLNLLIFLQIGAGRVMQ